MIYSAGFINSNMNAKTESLRVASEPIESWRRKRPYPRPDVWARPENVINSSIQDRANEIVLDLMFGSTPPLRKAVDLGFGRAIQGTVLGREDEDKKIVIDGEAEKLAYKIITRSAEQNGLSLFVFSEHEHLKIGDVPQVVGSFDPIDDSLDHQIGLNTPPYLALGLMDTNGNPIAAGVANLLTGHITINRNGKNYIYNPNEKYLIELPVPKKVESIKDPTFVPISYGGKYKYTHPFRANFDAVDRDRNQDMPLHGIAGSHIYGEEIATGAASAYIMFGEPISELVQGLAFARDAGYIVASVNPEDGSYEEYKFDVDFYLKNPDRYNTDRVPFLVVANSKPLLRELITYGFTKSLNSANFNWEN